MNNETAIERFANYMQEKHLGKENGVTEQELAIRFGVAKRTVRSWMSGVNNDPTIPRLVSTADACYMCATNQEGTEAIAKEYRRVVTEIKKLRVMQKKMGLDGQVKIPLGDDYKEVVEVFEK